MRFAQVGQHALQDGTHAGRAFDELILFQNIDVRHCCRQRDRVRGIGQPGLKDALIESGCNLRLHRDRAERRVGRGQSLCHCDDIRHHIPGNPRIIVQNMPGGGGKIAANYVYKVTPSDPFVILGPHADAHTAQLVGEPGVEYDVSQFNWIGSTSSDQRVLVMRSDTPYSTTEALLKARPKEIPLAVTGPGTGSYAFARLYEYVFKIEFRRLMYVHGPELYAAVERGEASGLPATLEGLLVTHSDWLKSGFIRVVLQGGERRHKVLPDVATIYEIANPRHHDVIRLMEGGGAWNKPFAMGPKVSREAVQIIRDAFMRTVSSPQYIEDSGRIGLNLDPMKGEVLQAKMREVVKQPPKIVDVLKDLFK